MSTGTDGAILEQIEKDIAAEWLIKSGLETKALAVMTASLASATLFFLVAAQLGLDPKADELPKATVIAALVLTVSTVTFALATIFVRSYSAISASTYEELRAAYSARPNDEAELRKLTANLIRGRIMDLADADSSNRRKSLCLTISVASMGVAAACLAVSLFTSSNKEITAPADRCVDSHQVGCHRSGSR